MPLPTPQYELVVRFHIDNGELDGETAEDAFVLGVEFALFHSYLVNDAASFEAPVHEQNVGRLEKACWQNQRQVCVKRSDNKSNWCTLVVGKQRRSK
jgi:hypothetical protein